jgi:hypothetical protein
MATLTKAMARDSFATSLADIYIVPSAATTAIVTNIVVTNTTNTSQSFNILLDGVQLFHNTPISGNSTISIDIKQVLDPSGTPKKITGFATATTLKYHISGIELT